MSNELPRAQIDELITKWTLAGLRTAVVEGESDQRFLHLLLADRPPMVSESVEFWPVDALHVPDELLEKHGVPGSGAKQKVIVFTREVSALAHGDGFRGIVDVDLDNLLGIDWRSSSLLYTDRGCLDAYLWHSSVLRQLLIQFRCETHLRAARDVRALYDSINRACGVFAAIRLAAARFPDLGLRIHSSDKAMSVANHQLHVDRAAYVRQMGIGKDEFEHASLQIDESQRQIERGDPVDCLNGHDLVRLLTFALRELSSLPRRLIAEEGVAGALLSHGLSVEA